MKRVCGDATLYARNGDAADLADKMRTVIDDPELAAAASAKRRGRA